MNNFKGRIEVVGGLWLGEVGLKWRTWWSRFFFCLLLELFLGSIATRIKSTPIATTPATSRMLLMLPLEKGREEPLSTLLKEIARRNCNGIKKHHRREQLMCNYPPHKEKVNNTTPIWNFIRGGDLEAV